MSNFGYISFGAIWSEPIKPFRLKLATLLFDRLYFAGSTSDNIVDRFIYRSNEDTNISNYTRNKLSKTWFGTDSKKREFSIYGEKEKWTWEHGPDSLKEATKKVLKLNDFFQETEDNKDTSEYYELYKLGGYIMSDILWWNNHFKKFTFIGDSIAEDIINNVKIINQDEGTTSYKVIPINNFANLNWDDIIALREMPFLKNFRKKYIELSETNQTEYIQDIYYKTLECLLDEFKPSTGDEIVKAVLTNLPINPINPFAWIASGSDIKKSIRLKKEYGWLFFMRELRNKAQLTTE